MADWHNRETWRATVAMAALVATFCWAKAEESALLAPGVAAYQAGKTDQAIKSLSGVLTSNTASGSDLARAYYYRGLAYAKSSKPAQAIADFNNALWLKGLAPDERANAYLQRGKAYQATGLETRAAQDFRDAEKLAPGAASAELAATEAAPPAAVDLQNSAEAASEAPATSGTTALVLSPSTVQTTATSTSKKATSTATVGGTNTSTAQSQGTGTLRERGGTVSRTSSTEALSTATVPSNNGSLSSIFSGGGSFFSDLFGSGGSTASSETAVTNSIDTPATETGTSPRQTTVARGESADWSAAAETTTVVAAAEPVQAPAVATDAPLVLAPVAETGGTQVEAGATPQTSSWSSTVGEEQASFAQNETGGSTGDGDVVSTVGNSIGSLFDGLFSGNAASDDVTSSTTAAPAAQPVPAEIQVATLAPSAAPIEATVDGTAPSGRYKAQVATVRSPEEADLIARRVRTERKAILGNLSTEVQPVVLGNMGTFYAVLIGPFPSERASERFCGKLQGEGVDCFVAEP